MLLNCRTLKVCEKTYHYVVIEINRQSIIYLTVQMLKHQRTVINFETLLDNWLSLTIWNKERYNIIYDYMMRIVYYFFEKFLFHFKLI